jgi:hypothetical protein
VRRGHIVGAIWHETPTHPIPGWHDTA